MTPPPDSQTRQPLRFDERLLPSRFLVVSNRLPYQLDVQGERVDFKRGVGGMVTALDPILHATGGTWIGWSGNYEPLPETVRIDERGDDGKRYHLRPVQLNREEIERYYLGYSNKALWPLFHYFQEHCEFDHEQWAMYEQVNRRFAEVIVQEYREGDLIWIHDYHLMLLPRMIRELLPQARIAFFLHIPFPSHEVYQVEPHAEQLLDGVLGSDMVGFHLDSYARNFIDTVSSLTEHRYSRRERKITVDGRGVKLAAYPISIDFDAFVELADRPEMPGKVRAILDGYRAETIAIGVDRLDYSKGIPKRLRAIEIMLERHPEIQGKFTFVQVSAPSRTKVRVYREMREEVERMVGHINGRFGGKGCIPIDYRYESYSQADLVAYYRAADLALVTPLRDGMNLVAKEYVASRLDDDGALVLSRFAGAAHELADAVIVNPYDPETMAERIYETITMPAARKRERMRRLRDVVRRNDVYWWLERILRDLR